MLPLMIKYLLWSIWMEERFKMFRNYKDYRSFSRSLFSIEAHYPKTKNLSELLNPEEPSYKVSDFDVSRECGVSLPVPIRQIRVSAMPKDY